MIPPYIGGRQSLSDLEPACLVWSLEKEGVLLLPSTIYKVPLL